MLKFISIGIILIIVGCNSNIPNHKINEHKKTIFEQCKDSISYYKKKHCETKWSYINENNSKKKDSLLDVLIIEDEKLIQFTQFILDHDPELN